MSSPKCPNHTVPLTDLQTGPGGKGVGICPISGYHFEYSADFYKGEPKMVKNKFGQLEQAIVYKQIDGGGVGG